MPLTVRLQLAHIRQYGRFAWSIQLGHMCRYGRVRIVVVTLEGHEDTFISFGDVESVVPSDYMHGLFIHRER
jgi:hypothetical protein